MVHALREAWRVLVVDGSLIDLRPVAINPALEVVTGERLEIERLTSRSEEGRWKSTHRGNSLAAYPTVRAVLRGLGGSNLGSSRQGCKSYEVKVLCRQLPGSDG